MLTVRLAIIDVISATVGQILRKGDEAMLTTIDVHAKMSCGLLEGMNVSCNIPYYRKYFAGTELVEPLLASLI